MTQNSEITCLLELELRLLQADVFGGLVRIILYHSFPNLGKSTNHLVAFIWIVHTPLLRLNNSPSILWAS